VPNPFKYSLVALAWVFVIVVAVGWHPALRDGAPLENLGQHIADDAA